MQRPFAASGKHFADSRAGISGIPSSPLGERGFPGHGRAREAAGSTPWPIGSEDVQGLGSRNGLLEFRLGVPGRRQCSHSCFIDAESEESVVAQEHSSTPVPAADISKETLNATLRAADGGIGGSHPLALAFGQRVHGEFPGDIVLQPLNEHRICSRHCLPFETSRAGQGGGRAASGPPSTDMRIAYM